MTEMKRKQTAFWAHLHVDDQGDKVGQFRSLGEFQLKFLAVFKAAQTTIAQSKYRVHHFGAELLHRQIL